MKYFFANWKMYLDFDEANILIHQILQETFDSENVGVGIFPSSIATADILKAAAGTPVAVGAQNVAWTPKGAYTGAISANMYKNLGCTHALVGHSERRHIFGETNDDIRKKLEACLEVGLTPILCIGETAEDVEAGKRDYRLKKQLSKALDGLALDSSSTFFIAYEPVWAIGTGDPCHPEKAEEVHAWIKEEISQYTDIHIPLLYGGSVNPTNVVSYVSSQQIDGVLVGGASAKFDSFIEIIRALESTVS